VFKAGVNDPSAAARGTFTDMADSVSGFGSLSISTSGNFSDHDQFYAAGYLEGALTSVRIHETYINMHAWLESNFGGG